MFSNEQGALTYISDNKTALLGDLRDNEIKTVYTNENTQINIMRNGKRLLKVINRFEGEKKLSDIYKDMIDLKLL